MDVPDLLTVEEAARLARIGRTKAYAMAREWRDTGGRSGLPVVDFGNVLRVPRRALEALIGAELTDLPQANATPTPTHTAATQHEEPSSQQEPQQDARHGEVDLEARTTTRRPRRRQTAPSDQLDLFAATPPAF